MLQTYMAIHTYTYRINGDCVIGSRRRRTDARGDIHIYARNTIETKKKCILKQTQCNEYARK